jgi:CheY-like chemotaxis protein
VRRRSGDLIAGRKLLLADDSVVIQRVVDLTFSDEGMEVTTVGDGQQALEELEQAAPDIVLADVFMPRLGGYALCEFIKQSERFGQIPVILLVGSFEPFDEAEARRVGADEVVTKPFQSIRQLVSRVGALLGGKSTDEQISKEKYSTLGLGRASASPASGASAAIPQTNLKVFVEAPSMADLDSPNAGAKTCQPDIEQQTADTMQLRPVDAGPASQDTEPPRYLQQDTLETPVIDMEKSMVESAPDATRKEPASFAAGEIHDNSSQQITQLKTADEFNDALLDLGDVDSAAPVATAEDLVLDLEDETPAEAPSAARFAEPSTPIVDATLVADAVAEESFREVKVVPAPEEGHEWAMVSATGEEAASPAKAEERRAESTAGQINLSELSPQAIDAIARRVVEQLSEKVVREIAWEVVPEMAELLIKRRLEGRDT